VALGGCVGHHVCVLQSGHLACGLNIDQLQRQNDVRSTKSVQLR
jgi:hypothetical protein